ncbi:MAG: ParB/RepB/Spo0J family partition protein [Eubacteriales bacterium]|nr:ParB/RepB/Spo0J family partition protein [Eubacteriales bacterium]
MAAQKTGLGRGLDALLDPYSVVSEEQQSSGAGVLMVNVREIDNNALQPRKQFDENSLNELADSIRTHGIVQPLIVKKKNNRYMIIAGERRFRAARLAGLSEVPVLVADYDEAQIHEVSLIENIQREDLNPIEEAAAIRFLMRQHDMTQEEVSARLGKSRPAIANSLRLLQLPESVIDLLKSGILSAGHGRALAGLADSAQIEALAKECVEQEYSVRALEEKLKRLSEKKKPEKSAKKEKPSLSAELTNLEESFREALGTRVSLAGSNTRGRITIEYYSREDLERVYEKLTKE